MSESSSFLDEYRGELWATRQWSDLDKMWEVVNADAIGDWYIYAVGEQPPEQTSSAEEVTTFVHEVNELLHREHEHDYCGIVYADDRAAPRFIKIFDPNNLGVSCGSSDFPPFPGWVMSKTKPVNLVEAIQPPNNRRRWWKKIFSD